MVAPESGGKYGHSSMNLFEVQVANEQLHPAFKRLIGPSFAAERAVIESWANGFRDRDGKFAREFQTTFDSSYWELYLHAVLKELRLELDQRHHAPDFLITGPASFTMEATISAPAIGGSPPVGPGFPDIPEDLNEFNRDSIVRTCNSISSKTKRYRDHYRTLEHVRDKPFVLALAPFDRPMSHLEFDRSIQAALYARYVDEEQTIAAGLSTMIEYGISAVMKRAGVQIPVGFFCSDVCKEVSAVVFSPIAGWGKMCALADAPDMLAIFNTLHASPHTLMPEKRCAVKRDYSEHLLDGLHILHNPFATHPLSIDIFDHPRVSQDWIAPDGEVYRSRPDDFLMFRQMFAISPISG
ncbi:hypothetical protein XA1314C_35020 [Xanthomonas arboricola]|uniref:Glycosaminoglycan attachment site n=2 Tax=Xanthomonas arboricola TaxID=56448 RepID=A0AAU9HZM4_9XANT|nr:hypothetical protein XA1314C_35020 [Xanthomonas arboricola]CAE6827855.1 hypothetical protein XA1314C_35020 [Xanthomonas arboricola]